MSGEAAWRVATAVKVNLHLGVGPRRRDGYHPLRTVFQTLDLGDVLEFGLRPQPGWSLRVDGPGTVPGGTENLVGRALALLERAMCGPGERFRPGVAVRLVKHVPAGAGLGGGSGDAGATLLALPAFLRRTVSRRRLLAMARELGADVPFFLDGGLMAAAGRGDRLRRLQPLPPLDAVIAVPPLHLATAAVYGWFDEESLTSGGGGFRMRPALGRLRRMGFVPDFRNDLERSVFRRHPQLAEMKDCFRSMGALVAGLSGSGSAVFALFGAPPALPEELQEGHGKGWEFHRCRTLTGREYRARYRRPAESS